MPKRTGWIDVVHNATNRAFIANLPPKHVHVHQIFDAIARYRACYNVGSLASWWFGGRNSKKYGDEEYYRNGWRSSWWEPQDLGNNQYRSYARLRLDNTTTSMKTGYSTTRYATGSLYPALGSTHRYLIMKVRSNQISVTPTIYWSRKYKSGKYWEDRNRGAQSSYTLPKVSGNSQWQYITIDMYGVTDWVDYLNELEIRWVRSGSNTTYTVDIAYIMIEKDKIPVSTAWRGNWISASNMRMMRTMSADMNGTSPSWTDATITSNTTKVKAIHFKEIRDQIYSAEGKHHPNTGCTTDMYWCDMYSCGCDDCCDSEGSCGCEGEYDFECYIDTSYCELDIWGCTCYDSCYDYSSCDCDYSSDSDSCLTCDQYAPNT